MNRRNALKLGILSIFAPWKLFHQDAEKYIPIPDKDGFVPCVLPNNGYIPKHAVIGDWIEIPLKPYTIEEIAHLRGIQ